MSKNQKKEPTLKCSLSQEQKDCVNGVIPEAEVIVLDPNQDGVLAIALNSTPKISHRYELLVKPSKKIL